MFPSTDVRDDARLVVDGKFITSVGGGMSYEPAFYLVERLFGPEHARLTAEGLVWPWELETMPHVVVDAEQGPFGTNCSIIGHERERLHHLGPPDTRRQADTQRDAYLGRPRPTTLRYWMDEGAGS